jgi:energy-converting hydrogenase Eha subunit A
MLKFAVMIGIAVALFAIALVLYLKTPSGRTKKFLGLAWISALAFPICAVLHNVVDGVFHVEEPVFFLLAVIGAPVGILVGLAGAAFSAYTGRLARR